MDLVTDFLMLRGGAVNSNQKQGTMSSEEGGSEVDSPSHSPGAPAASAAASAAPVVTEPEVVVSTMCPNCVCREADAIVRCDL